MDGSLHLSTMVRLLALNTENCELRNELMRQPVDSPRIAQLQEDIDRNSRSGLTACWLSGGYELEPEDEDFEGDWEDGLAAAD